MTISPWPPGSRMELPREALAARYWGSTREGTMEPSALLSDFLSSRMLSTSPRTCFRGTPHCHRSLLPRWRGTVWVDTDQTRQKFSFF